MMTIQDMLPKLEAWNALYLQLNAQAEALHNLTLAAPESPLVTALWSIWEAYTITLAENLSDQGEWLLWYWLECDMGTNPMAVTLSGKDLRVRTLRHLARVITHVNAG